MWELYFADIFTEIHCPGIQNWLVLPAECAFGGKSKFTLHSVQKLPLED